MTAPTLVQFGGTSPTGSASSRAMAFGSSVTAGNLAIVKVVKYDPSGTPDTFVLGDFVASGTATLSDESLDGSQVLDTGADALHCAVWSALITGNGTLTVTVSGVAGSYFLLSYEEYSHANGWDTNRAGTAASATGSTNTPASGNATVTDEGVLAAIMGTYAAGTEYTEDTAYNQGTPPIFEQDASGDFMNGASASQTVDGGLTDNATWSWPAAGNSWVCLQVPYNVAAAGGIAIPLSRQPGTPDPLHGLVRGI